MKIESKIQTKRLITDTISCAGDDYICSSARGEYSDCIVFHSGLQLIPGDLLLSVESRQYPVKVVVDFDFIHLQVQETRLLKIHLFTDFLKLGKETCTLFSLSRLFQSHAVRHLKPIAVFCNRGHLTVIIPSVSMSILDAK